MANSNRTGKRRHRSEFKNRVPSLGRYIIFTDTTDTEEKYLYGLRDSLPDEFKGRIVIKVIRTKTERLIVDCLDEMSIYPQYCEPWIVFDRDEVVGFDAIVREAEKHGIYAGWSNPCIEIWFEAYFGVMDANCTTSRICCQRFNDIFKKRTGQEYKKSNPQNYDLLTRFGDVKSAIALANKKLKYYRDKGESSPHNMCPCTTLHILVEEILRKTEFA